MKVAELQEFVDSWIAANGGYWPILSNLARLTEEVGELARHVNAHEGIKPLPDGTESAAGEIGDVLFTIAALARQLDVDLEQAVAALVLKQRARGMDGATVGQAQ